MAIKHLKGFKRKSDKEIIEMLLREKCVAALKSWECIASDNVGYVLRDEEQFEEYYQEWLIRHGYAV